MIRQQELKLKELFEADETAWLDAMADLIRRGEHQDLDYTHLEEYLTDMARRDRREVESRLTVLIAHVLKWLFQPDQRTRGWHATIIEQRQELARLVARGVLRNHAEAVLADMYADGLERAVAETGLPTNAFPADCPFTLEQLLEFNPTAQ